MQRTNSQSSSGSLQPCSGSILLNPLSGPSPAAASTSASTASMSPPALGGLLASASRPRPRRPSVAICVSATAEPPSWYEGEGGTQPGTPYGSPPKGSGKSRSNSVDRWGVDSDDSGDDRRPEGTSTRGRLPCGKETSIQFAPLPAGRPRSNSITIGVASRANMLNAQGGAANGQYNRQQARFAGPQWCQAGGTVPPDVYTYKDLARGLSNVWRKAKKARRPSTASTTSSASAEQALDMERDAKSKGAIEHIEEADEDPADDEDYEHALADSSSDGEGEGEADGNRGRAVGMAPGAFRTGSVESSSSGEGSEGSGALSTSETSAGAEEGADAKWEAEAVARRARKGKGKAALQAA